MTGWVTDYMTDYMTGCVTVNSDRQQKETPATDSRASKMWLYDQEKAGDLFPDQCLVCSRVKQTVQLSRVR